MSIAEGKRTLDAALEVAMVTRLLEQDQSGSYADGYRQGWSDVRSFLSGMLTGMSRVLDPDWKEDGKQEEETPEQENVFVEGFR